MGLVSLVFEFNVAQSSYSKDEVEVEEDMVSSLVMTIVEGLFG